MSEEIVYTVVYAPTIYDVFISDGGARVYTDLSVAAHNASLLSHDLPRGSCYGNEIDWTQASAVQNQWYIIADADMSDGNAGLHSITHDGSGKLTATYAGDYDIDGLASVECSVLNKHVQIAVAVNGAVVDVTPHYEVRTPDAQLALPVFAQVSLAAGGYVQIAIRTTDTGAPNLFVDHLAIKMKYVGA